jgi:DNA-binding beta-propeller fold protein YncE
MSNPFQRSTLAAGIVLLLGSCGSGSGGGGAGLVDLVGPQTGSMTIQLASGMVTFPSDPQALDLSATAVYDDASDSVDVALTLRNGSTSTLQNAKVVPSGLSEGTVISDADYPGPADGGLVFVAYGPEQILPGDSVTRTLRIEGVGGAAPEVTLDLEVVQHPSLVFLHFWNTIGVVDAAGGLLPALIDVHSLGFRGDLGDARFQAYAVSADGRYVDFAARNQPAVLRFDLADFSASFGPSLAPLSLGFDGNGPVGSVDSLTPSPDRAYLYAVLNDGAHAYRHSQTYPAPAVELVKLDALDLSVVDRVEVMPSSVIPPVADGGTTYVEYRGRRLSVSADGTLGALAITGVGTVMLVDLATMTVLDQDALALGNQGFDVSATSQEPRLVALSPSGETIYVAHAGPGDGTLDVIDVASGGITALAPPTPSSIESKNGFLEFGPDGRLYYGRQEPGVAPGLSIYDTAGSSWVELPALQAATAIAFGGSDYCVRDDEAGELRCFTYAADAAVPAPATGLFSLPGSSLAGHGLVRTSLP